IRDGGRPAGGAPPGHRPGRQARVPAHRGPRGLHRRGSAGTGGRGREPPQRQRRHGPWRARPFHRHAPPGGARPPARTRPGPPRRRGKVRVTTRVQGKPVAAEVELGIVDEPVFSLHADRAPDIRRFFLRPREDDTLTIASGYYGDECETFTYRGGALAGAVIAVEEAAGGDASVRRNFPDTMLWLGHVRTGEDGKAEVDVEMPDSLTTWRLSARAVSGDDRFGSAVSKTLCRKDVMVRLAAPRFFTERDHGLVSGIVHNESRKALEFRVRMEADGLEVEGGEKKVAVPAGGSARLEWAVKAAAAGPARLRIFAESPGGSDAMEVALPVHPHGFEKVALRTGVL